MNSICNGSLTPVKNFQMNAVPCTFGMVKHSILYPYFEEIMDKLIPSGIPQYLPDFHALLMYGNYETINEKMPKVLTLNDLSFGFILWMIACGMSMIGFVGEILIFYLSRILKNIVGLWMVLKLIITYKNHLGKFSFKSE